MAGADGHRWYWENRCDETWEEFDQANNDKLDKHCSKGKPYSHITVNDQWQQVTFTTMKMRKINFCHETSVKRSGSKPIYEALDGSDIDHDIHPVGVSTHKEEFSRPLPDQRSSGDKDGEGAVRVADDDFSPSEKDSKKRKPHRRRKRKEHGDKDTRQPFVRRAVKKHDYNKGERKLAQQRSRESKEERSDPELSPSDKEKTDRRRHMKKSEENYSRKSFGRRSDRQHDSITVERERAQQRPKKFEDDRSEADGSDIDHDIHPGRVSKHKKESSMSLQDSSRSGDKDGQGAVRDDNFSPSDDDRKKRKHERRRIRKEYGDKDTRQPFVRRADKQRDDNTGHGDDTSYEDKGKGNDNHRSHRQERVNTEAHTLPLDDKRSLRMKDSTGEQKYLFQDESALHYEAHHGGIHFLHTFAQSNAAKVWPLHVASSLGLKQNVSYLLQTGWDLDEKDQHGETPVQKADNQMLAEYMERFKCPAETETVELQPQGGDDTHDGYTVLPIIMDKVDLSTRKVYLPSFQFRKTFQKEQHKRLLFTSRFITTYETVCQHQLYGVLWLLGKYGKDMLTCLNDICLPDWSIQRYRDIRTGKLDVTAWLRNNEQRRQQQQQQQHTETRTPTRWIQSILEDNIEQFKAELQRGIEHLDDGWTPLHYAILTRQHDLVKFLVHTQNVNLETRTSTLLPQFILDELKHRCTFEYDYVYKHTVGFTPLLLATFIGNKDAIDILGKHVTRQLDLGDCLTLAYCDETEDNLLNIMCGLGEKYIYEKYNVNMKLHSVYKKECSNRRILIGSSNKIHRRIEEGFFPVRLILDNENITRELLKPSTSRSSAKDTEILGQILQSHADQLWRRHSNLNAIIPGRTSSLSEDRCNDEIMVVLHCSHKGFIHTGELPFQKYIRNGGECVRVHVIQGVFRLGPGGNTNQTIDSEGEKAKVQVGYKVKYVDEDLMATLGMMVEDLDGNTGILTCAHTFLSDFMKNKTVPSYDKLYDKNGPLKVEVLQRKPELWVAAHQDMDVGEEVPQRSMMPGQQTTGSEGAAASSARFESDCEMVDVDLDKRGFHVNVSMFLFCLRLIDLGYVRRVLFKTDTDVAIDVALIMLDKEVIKLSPKLHFCAVDEDDKKEQLKAVDTNFQRNDLKFDSGQSFEQKEKKPDPGYKVIKCGIKTQLTVGALAFSDTSPRSQVKVTTDTCKIDGFILKGQLVVYDKDTVFFHRGDSGSAVFVKTNNTLQCLGIAIGRPPGSSETLVTPIKHVLDALTEQPEGASRLLEYKLK